MADKLGNCSEERQLVNDGAKLEFQVSLIPEQGFYKEVCCPVLFSISSYRAKCASKMALRIFAKNDFAGPHLRPTESECLGVAHFNKLPR